MNDFESALLVLLLAHLVGDFLLQPSVLISKKKKITWLLIHSLVHGALAYLLMGAWNMWLPPLIITFTHFLFDGIKNRVISKDKKGDSLIVFVIDQALHFIVLVLMVQFFYIPNAVLPVCLNLYPAVAAPVLLILVGVLLLVPFGGILIDYVTHPFQEQLHRKFHPNSLRPIEGLKEGGRIIGYLERLLIFVFILSGEFAGVGFLVAAKSILRFGEIKDNENRKQSEYIIIGTFASFLLAFVVSLAVRSLLQVPPPG